MDLSIFTTIKNPVTRGDEYMQALNCYQELADEVIVMNGGDTIQLFDVYEHEKMKFIDSYWPNEFDWPFIGQQFQRGYEACSGDWVIRADLDMIFHERDYRAIRMACLNNPDEVALSFWKFQFVLPDRYNLKSRIVVAVNKKKYGDRIRFDSGGDLCQPSLDGVYINPAHVPEAQIPIYNYEKLCKTKEQIMDDVGRMERAYKRHFGKSQYNSDTTNENAYDKWYEAQRGKLQKPHKFIDIKDHPKVIQETIKNLKPEQFGHSGLGLVEGKRYA